MFKSYRIILFLMLIIPVFVFSACTQNNKSSENSISTPDQSTEEEILDQDNKKTNPRYIVMLGRSVMNDWFNHWNWDGKSPMQLERYTLEYRKLSPPPDIVDSVRTIMEDLPENKKDVVFFKFCFEDFQGDDAASDNLDRNKRIIEEVHEIVTKEHGAELIIGNALPRVIGDTDIYLVWNHQQFISWLNDFWRDHPENLTVFDMYNPITNDLGALKNDYAISEDDSHLNDQAYSLLDEKFFNILDNVY